MKTSKVSSLLPAPRLFVDVRCHVAPRTKEQQQLHLPKLLYLCSLKKGGSWSEGEFALFAVLVYAILTADRARLRIIRPESTSTEVEPWGLKNC